MGIGCMQQMICGNSRKLGSQFGTTQRNNFIGMKFQGQFLADAGTAQTLVPVRYGIAVVVYAVLMLVLTPFSFLQSGCALGVDALLSAQDAGIGSKIDEEAGSFRREHSGGFYGYWLRQHRYCDERTGRLGQHRLQHT